MVVIGSSEVLHAGEFGEAADEAAVGGAERHREAEQHPQHADDGHGAERHHHHVGRALDRHHAAVEEREAGDHHREADDATQHECCGSCIHIHLLEWCGSGESRSLAVTDVSVTWTGFRCCLHVNSRPPVTVRAMKLDRRWWAAIGVAVVAAVALCCPTPCSTVRPRNAVRSRTCWTSTAPRPSTSRRKPVTSRGSPRWPRTPRTRRGPTGWPNVPRRCTSPDLARTGHDGRQPRQRVRRQAPRSARSNRVAGARRARAAGGFRDDGAERPNLRESRRVGEGLFLTRVMAVPPHRAAVAPSGRRTPLPPAAAARGPARRVRRSRAARCRSRPAIRPRRRRWAARPSGMPNTSRAPSALNPAIGWAISPRETASMVSCAIAAPASTAAYRAVRSSSPSSAQTRTSAPAAWRSCCRA